MNVESSIRLTVGYDFWHEELRKIVVADLWQE